MRFIPVLLLIAWFSISLSSQINGITASKISSFNATSINKYSAEFELQYGFSHSRYVWDASGDKQSLFQSDDSLSVSGSVGFRAAYALTDQLEIGAFVNSSGSNWATKLNVYDQNQLSFALMAGMYLPFGTSIVDKRNRQASQVSSFALGVIGSYSFTNSASLDINIQLQDYMSSAPGLTQSDRFFSIDYGHYIQNQSILLIGSFSYQHSSADGGDQTALYFNPGISLEMNPKYLIIANGSFGVFGKNMQRSDGFNIAWMMGF